MYEQSPTELGAFVGDCAFRWGVPFHRTGIGRLLYFYRQVRIVLTQRFDEHFGLVGIHIFEGLSVTEGDALVQSGVRSIDYPMNLVDELVFSGTWANLYLSVSMDDVACPVVEDDQDDGRQQGEYTRPYRFLIAAIECNQKAYSNRPDEQFRISAVFEYFFHNSFSFRIHSRQRSVLP